MDKIDLQSQPWPELSYLFVWMVTCSWAEMNKGFLKMGRLTKKPKLGWETLGSVSIINQTRIGKTFFISVPVVRPCTAQRCRISRPFWPRGHNAIIGTRHVTFHLHTWHHLATTLISTVGCTLELKQLINQKEGKKLCPETLKYNWQHQSEKLIDFLWLHRK